jgi:uncharacterized protein with PIN domain
MMTSQPWLTNCGKPGAVQKDHRKKIGSMPPKNYDHAPTTVEPEGAALECPKCGAEMESIEIEVEELPIQQLQLCPGCYLVTWSDQDGLHMRQGVPMTKGSNTVDPGWVAGEPEEC